MADGMRGLDAWITSGRYSTQWLIVTCPCGDESEVKAETDYGATTWTPGGCAGCGRAFTGDEPWYDDEPPEAEFNYGL